MNTATASSKNKKNVLVLFSSPNKNKTTSKMLDSVLEVIKSSSNITIFDCFEKNIQPCFDCKDCRESGICSVNDTFLDLSIDIEKSDVIIIATPIYFWSVPAPLKAVLDRFNQYYVRRFVLNFNPPIRRPKKALILACCGSDDNSGFEIILKQFKSAFSVMNTKIIDTLFIDQTDNLEKEADRINKMHEFANNIENKLMEIISE